MPTPLTAALRAPQAAELLNTPSCTHNGFMYTGTSSCISPAYLCHLLCQQLQGHLHTHSDSMPWALITHTHMPHKYITHTSTHISHIESTSPPAPPPLPAAPRAPPHPQRQHASGTSTHIKHNAHAHLRHFLYQQLHRHLQQPGHLSQRRLTATQAGHTCSRRLPSGYCTISR